MVMRGQDYLQRPPQVEVQTTKDDIAFASQMMMQKFLSEIRDELRMQNPSVLCETIVQGGNAISDLANHRITFQAGGKPVAVYKILFWSNCSQNMTGQIRLSVTSMSEADDGFIVQVTLGQLHVPVSELGIALNIAGTIGVNVPTSVNTDGSVFIYGFTTPNQLD